MTPHINFTSVTNYASGLFTREVYMEFRTDVKFMCGVLDFLAARPASHWKRDLPR